MIALDKNMNVKKWNQTAADLFGWHEEEVIDRPFPILPEFEKDAFHKMFTHVINGNVLTNVEAKRKRKNGTLIDATINPLPWYDDQGRINGYIAIIKDISAHKKNERKLAKTIKRLEDYKYVLDASSSITIIDSEGKIIYANDHFCEISKFKKDELLGKHYTILDSQYHPKRYFKKMWATIMKGDIWKGEVKNLTKDGGIWWANTTIVPLIDGNNKPVQYIAICSDITDRKLIEEELRKQQREVEYMAYFDYLTGLPNRRLFELELKQRLSEAQENCAMFALLFIDLDGFKFINDTLGHEIGDKLLREVSERFIQSKNESDVISRIGGDEFTIIVANVNDIAEIQKVAQRILALFINPFLIDNYTLHITASIGISIYPDGGESTHSLIQNADLALYRAKDDGKNTYEIFSPRLSIGAYKKFSLQNDLRDAINNGELFLQYQPKVDSKTHTIVRVEALARWDHPEWGIVSPDEFISLAEQSGLISMIGKQVLLIACKQNKKWQDEGYAPIKIGVNFSPLQFLQADLVEMVEKVLEQTGLEAKWLEIELTETAVLKNEVAVLSKLNQLRKLGITIAIDDFGTGFSSLSHLKKIKPDTVKIDKSFIKEIPADQESTEIATSIIKLAERLKIHVVAEGVETSEQAAYLRKIHCTYLQGYFFSKPLSAGKFERLLRRGKCHLGDSIKTDAEIFENRRAYYRIELPRPLIAEMTIASIGGKKIQVGMTKVLIEDIGPGGVKFSSNIKLPTRPDLILRIRTYILEEKVEATGSIVWGKEVGDIQQYGFQFDVDDKQRDEIISILNKFQVKLRNQAVSSTSWFLSISRQKFFNFSTVESSSKA